MAALSNADKKEVLKDWISTKGKRAEAIGALVKNDLKDAIDGMDDYVVANASAMNTAIPQPARGTLSPADKAELYSLVMLKRYEKGA